MSKIANQQEYNNSLHKGFVELCRMAGIKRIMSHRMRDFMRVLIGCQQHFKRKLHRPSRIGNAPIHLTIDKVGDAPEKQPDCRNRRAQIPERQKAHSVHAGEQQYGEDNPEQAPVKGHAAFPSHEYSERIAYEGRRFIE
jgi:hypothetical protein